LFARTIADLFQNDNHQHRRRGHLGEMSFTEVGNQSGYQRTTTFYHDFKARFGMPPAEYREQELKK
jgi:AraC-like DNA-binding protein